MVYFSNCRMSVLIYSGTMSETDVAFLDLSCRGTSTKTFQLGTLDVNVKWLAHSAGGYQ